MGAGSGRFCRGLAVLFALAAPPPLPAQPGRTPDLGSGKLLVASRDLGDPNFAGSVVLLVHYDAEGVVGLIVNRPTKVPISRALEDLKAAKTRSDPIYAGGPVGRSSVLALARSHTKIEDAEHVFGDVYLVTTATLLEKIMAGSDALHVYIGYAGWTARQLENEIGLGAWHVFPGDPAVVFSTRPELVWPRLIERTEQRVAFANAPAPRIHSRE